MSFASDVRGELARLPATEICCARSELAAGNYVYDQEADKYTLTNDEALYQAFRTAYLQFSDWLAKYEL